MKTSKTFSIHFWLKKTAIKMDGRVPIYVRITVDGNRADLSVKRFVTEQNWCTEAGRVSTRASRAKDINDYLDDVYYKLVDCHKQLSSEFNYITASYQVTIPR